MTSIEYSEDPKMRMAQKVVFWTVIVLAGVTVFGLLFGFLIQFLWNSTLVPLFDVSTISFWQAVGLFILAKIVFGFGGGSSQSGGKSKKSEKSKKKQEQEDDNKKTGVTSSEITDEPGEDADLVSEFWQTKDRIADQDADLLAEFWQAEGKEAYAAFQARKGDAD
ncbi:MAG: hypothetical protein GKR90_09030 [Pseudomonadales bacterium]|nr:hypothetical protein [Pseudomonadales bacterium]